MAGSFREDFNGTTYDTSKWTFSGNPAYFSISGGYATFSGNSNYTDDSRLSFVNVPTLSINCYVEEKTLYNWTNTTGHSIGFTINGIVYAFKYQWDILPGNLYIQDKYGSTNLGSGYYGQQRVYRVEYLSSNEVKFYIDGTLIRTTTGVTAGTIVPLENTYCFDGGGRNQVVDYVSIDQIGNLNIAVYDTKRFKHSAK